MTLVVTPVMSETESALAEERSKKSRKVESASQVKKKEKPPKYDMRINLQNVNVTDPDELLAHPLQLEEEEDLEVEGEG